MKHQFLLATALLGVGSWGWVLPVDRAAPPAITTAPKLTERQLRAVAAARDVDPISLAELLLTAIPQSLKEVAVTNIAEASSILWSEFLDDNKPAWFTKLPFDVQSYLVDEFGPDSQSHEASTTDSDTSARDSHTTGKSSTGQGTSSQTASKAASHTHLSETSRIAAQTGSGTDTATVSSRATDPADANAGTSDDDDDAPATPSGAIIGLGVGLAVAIIVIAILLFLLIRTCRKRRRDRKVAEYLAEPKGPEPAFVSSMMVPAPTRHARSGSRTSDPFRGDEELDPHEGPFADPSPPAAALGAARHGDDMESYPAAHNAYSSLSMVPEESVEGSDHHGDIGVVPARDPRRRDSILEEKDQFTTSTLPLDGYNHHNRYPPNWENQHPALRNHRYSETPAGQYQPLMDTGGSITRKPVPSQNGDGLRPMGNHTSISASNHHDWPFLNGGVKRSRGGYWTSQRPRYDRYEQVEEGIGGQY